jgi:hypothetical protein
MKYTTIKTDALEKFGNKLLKQQEDVAIENACLYAAELLDSAWIRSRYKEDKYNLYDSFVWIVSFNGKKIKHGFLSETERSKASVQQTSTKNMLTGRVEADKFVSEFKPEMQKGIEIVFAAAIYYAAYLEEGFTNTLGKEVQRQVLYGIKDRLNLDFGLVNVRTTYFTY